MAEIVRIKNVGDSDFRDGFDGRTYVIPAGAETMVDYNAMCLWLGHPMANNYDPRNRVRVQEYQRLRVRYGVSAKELELNQKGQLVDTDGLFKQMRPKLEVYNLDGSPILTVADDPDGTFLTTPDDQSGDSQQLIMARMHQMEQEMANLRNQLAQQARAEQALNDAVPTPTDTSDRIIPSQDQGIPGTVPAPPPDPTAPSIAPRPEPRSAPGEDAPNRVRVSSE